MSLCNFHSRYAEGDWPDWPVVSRHSLAPPSARPWHPHRERRPPGPYPDPQVLQVSPCHQLPLSHWGSMSTAVPLPHLLWAPLVRTEPLSTVNSRWPLSHLLPLSRLCCPFFNGPEETISSSHHGQMLLEEITMVSWKTCGQLKSNVNVGELDIWPVRLSYTLR